MRTADTRRRRLSAWLLLAVFLPMLLCSSLHVHPASLTAKADCTACVDHHCDGHIAQQTGSLHACVLCQFLTLTFLSTATVAVVLLVQAANQLPAQHRRNVAGCAYGLQALRAPPALI